MTPGQKARKERREAAEQQRDEGNGNRKKAEGKRKEKEERDNESVKKNHLEEFGIETRKGKMVLKRRLHLGMAGETQ